MRILFVGDVVGNVVVGGHRTTHGAPFRHIDTLVAEWRNEVERCRNSRRKLEYQVPDHDSGRDRLLYNHDDRIKGLWPTLQSLRNVENTALLKAL